MRTQGGAWCNDEASCEYRWENSPDQMSSKGWTYSKDFSSGIFSTDPSLNPWYNANQVYCMYCSSDIWSGGRFSGKWHFNGKAIMAGIFEKLWSDHGLDSADHILLSGCSAGAQGVVVNLDFIDAWLMKKQSTAVFKGFGDAGWLQNFVPFDPNTTISTATQLQEGYALWGGHPEVTCEKANPGWEWMCYFSPIAYPHIRTPIFIQTEQFDTYQVTSNVGWPPFSDSQLAYVEHTIRPAFDASLVTIQEPDSFFSAGCFHHCSSEDTSFNTITINGVTLAQALSNWYFEQPGPIREIATCRGFNCSVGCPTSAY